MSNLFEEIEDAIWFEDVKSCEEFDGGLQECEIYYCPYTQVTPFVVPSLFGSFATAGLVSENIVAKEGCSFQRIHALMDQSELSVSGNTTSLKFFVLGLRAELIGMKRILEAMPGIYLVVDNNNRYFVIGNTLSPAIASVSLSSGKTHEDNSGANITLQSNMIFFEYTGQMPLINNNSDFTDEHTDEHN